MYDIMLGIRYFRRNMVIPKNNFEPWLSVQIFIVGGGPLIVVGGGRKPLASTGRKLFGALYYSVFFSKKLEARIITFLKLCLLGCVLFRQLFRLLF